MQSTTHSPETSPITVLARHTVEPGRELQFKEWMNGITAACQSFSGYMGTEVIRPRARGDNEFVSIFRFDTDDHLEAWMDSKERSVWLDRMSEFSSEAPRVDYHSLEFWFEPDTQAGGAPPRYKMALVTYFCLWPLVHFIPPLVAEVTSVPLVVEAGSLATIVLLMTYAVMPAVTSVLSPWLFGRKNTA